MNEVKISPVIPYSIAHDMFIVYFECALECYHIEKVNKIIEFLKENWIILNSDTKGLIIHTFKNKVSQKEYFKSAYYKMLNDFIAWAEENRKTQSTTTRPLNDFVELPVVNMSKGE